MVLFIFESIGTSELILIGIVALVLLGPRKLPEIARKAGKIMSDLKNTTNDFRSTWEKEVDLANERDEILESERRRTVAREKITDEEAKPEIRPIDRSEFEKAVAEKETPKPTLPEEKPLAEKHDWL